MASTKERTALLTVVRKALGEPRLAGVDLNSGDRMVAHREILGKKAMLREVFCEFHRLCRSLDQIYFSGIGDRIELGSGTGLAKEIYPDVLLSDIVPAAHLNLVLDAERMSLGNNSVRAFYAVNTFHHLSSPDRFLAELLRVLVPGGGCILIEPYYGPGASVFYRALFAAEKFDKTQRAWDTHKSSADVMTQANQALSYVVFRRDADLLQARYPGLEFVYSQRIHNYLRYFFSGGLNYRQLLPDCAIPFLHLLEWLARPIDHLWALHHVIVLRKAMNHVP